MQNGRNQLRKLEKVRSWEVEEESRSPPEREASNNDLLYDNPPENAMERGREHFLGFGAHPNPPLLPPRQHSTPPVYAAHLQAHYSAAAQGLFQHSSFSEEDEPNDVLAYNTSYKSYQNLPQPHPYRRSHSDTDEPFKSATSAKNLQKSKSVKSMSARGQESNGNLLPEEYEGHLASVTKQLENIQTTQDSILAELSDDISNLQFENVQLKNTNEHLTMQNSHLLQVISDLSGEVEQMREIFRIRSWSVQQLGASVNNNIPLLDDSKRFSSRSQQEEENKKSLDPEASPKRRHRPRSLASPKFENSPNKTSEDTTTRSRDQSPWPGNDQVAVSSNPKETTVEPVKQRRSRQRPRSLTESNASTTRTKKSSDSKPSVSSFEEKEDSVVSSGNCFKNLFKRNKK